MTACSQPPGTYMVSPGRCTTSIGRGPAQPGAIVRGHTRANQSAASRPRPGSRGCISSLDVPGGNRAQRLRPASSAFHAAVARGSTWRLDPDLGGPMTSQL